MIPLVIVDDPDRWALRLKGAQVVAAKAYLTDPGFVDRRGSRVLNLCSSYAYQSTGYYVTLLAEARGHRPLPNVVTIQDLRMRNVIQLPNAELEEQMQEVLGVLTEDKFVLSIYFGQALEPEHDRLAALLHAEFEAPLLRAHFKRERSGWRLTRVGAIPAGEIPEHHREYVQRFAGEYFGHTADERPAKRPTVADLAILVDPRDEHPPSNELGLQRFSQAAEKLGLRVRRLTSADYSRLPEFDALFIRTTTAVDHYTYRFSRRAERLGIPVIDDAQSIVRCTNKVYLKELLERSGIRSPRSLVVHSANREQITEAVGVPTILKQPDGAFSMGVHRAESRAELDRKLDRMLGLSELVLAQEFLPTPFDCRIGVLGQVPLYACKYHMAGSHWQIIQHSDSGAVVEGRVEAVALADVPEGVLAAATRATELIGSGLYGVDLKEVDGKAYVIEINDNPNLDGDFEDLGAGAELWNMLARRFLDLIELSRGEEPPQA